ncbi:MAG: DegT/DnrJ/EryC1/StrS family aminotransferase [Dehalococcoidia bacterium]|nr:DegT/DnrJ/EryC1/StrS family aminotransferase [Dehalococcoidia bacterium]
MTTVTRVPFVELQAQYSTIGAEIEARVLEVLRNAQYIGGPEVAGLEAEFAAYCGTAEAIAVNSGTAALHVALLALGVGPGDEVITVAHTFVATAEAVVQAGATPVFVDIEPVTMGMDPAQLERAITPRTRAIIPVHLYGQPARIDEIQAIAERHGIPVIEDACQAHGARLGGRRMGAFGTIGCFSFYPSKNLGAIGEGGIAVTDSPELASRMRLFRAHGEAENQRYRHEVVGYNYRLPAIQAAALRVKLPHLDGWSAQRRDRARRYDELLADTEVVTPRVQPGAEHVYHLYPIRHPRRDGLQRGLAEAGIQTGIHYPIPVHLQTPYAQYGAGRGSLPQTEAAAAEVLSLPMYAELRDDQIDHVVSTLQRLVQAL